MPDFFLLFLHECVEVIEGMTEGREVNEMGDELITSFEQLENFVAVGIVFNIAPELVSSESNGFLGHGFNRVNNNRVSKTTFSAQSFVRGQSLEEVLGMRRIPTLLLYSRIRQSAPKCHPAVDRISTLVQPESSPLAILGWGSPSIRSK
jgi:hypothetical protein